VNNQGRLEEIKQKDYSGTMKNDYKIALLIDCDKRCDGYTSILLIKKAVMTGLNNVVGGRSAD